MSPLFSICMLLYYELLSMGFSSSYELLGSFLPLGEDVSKTLAAELFSCSYTRATYTASQL
jgi:hypothetical protein